MCYSSLLEKAYDEYLKMFAAPYDMQAFRLLYRQRELDLLLKIPSELDDILIAIDPINAGIIRESVRQWRANCSAEIKLLEAAIAELQAALPKKATAEMKKPLNAAKSRKKRIETALKSESAEGPSYRIYPKYFAPVIIAADQGRITVPMRYRILPATGVEIPDTYNVFNAKRESLTSARTWKPLFGRKHAIFPFQKFYEWVEPPPTRRKTEIEFSPSGIPRMWAASLYEEYHSPVLGLIRSFAMVTDDPPEEIKITGHDRVPIFIDENLIHDWLHPEGKTPESLDALLGHKHQVYFDSSLAA